MYYTFAEKPQHEWGEREVDVGAEVAAAMALLEPPLRATKQQVEAAILGARGSMTEATEVRATLQRPGLLVANTCKMICRSWSRSCGPRSSTWMRPPR